LKPVPVESLPVDLVRRIQRDTRSHFQLAELPVATAAWQILNPYSLVLCIQWSNRDWSQRVFVKLPLGPVDPVAAAKYSQPEHSTVLREFNVLSMLAPLRVANVRGLVAGTVVPLANYIDLFALVTVDAGGTTLRRTYTRHARRWALPRDRGALLEQVELCGRWLSEFHASTAQGHDGFHLDELQAYCRTRLEKMHRLYPAVLSTTQAELLMTAAARVAARIPPDSLRISGRHNDFASHNIIARPDGGISVLDFTMYDHGANAFDVCNFWFELEMLQWDPTYSRSLLSDAQRLFLASYGGMTADSPDFILARLRYAINRLLNALGEAKSQSGYSLHRHLSVRSIRGWLDALGAL
jgi:aminoglycoside phosphotransferase (APT) family kinase protein